MRLLALDVKTGRPSEGFGDDFGDLSRDIDWPGAEVDWSDGESDVFTVLAAARLRGCAVGRAGSRAGREGGKPWSAVSEAD